ncbi:MAG: substrate-binding domain-containing protein [Actinobacteria bacterium]|nr:substrate-binding domain-containing protein [Actinomycetota bacterium]
MRFRQVTLRLLGAAALVGGSLLGGATPSFASGGGGPTAASVLGSGSDTTQFVMSDLDKLYLFSPGCAQIPTPSGPTPWLDFSCQSPDPAGTVTTENYEHDQVHQAYFLGSSNGIKQLCTQGTAGTANIDYARSSRVPAATDCAGLNFVAYARDGISVETANISGSGAFNMNNTSGACAGTGGTANNICLTQAQLQGIFVNCTITNWDQVGGNNVPITIYTAQPGSGTRAQFDTFLGGSSDSCIPAAQKATHIIPENSNAGLIFDGSIFGLIMPFSFGVWHSQVFPAFGNFAPLAAVDGVPVNPTTITDLTFPYGRFLFNVYNRTTNPAGTPTNNYISEQNGWLCKPASAHSTNPVTGNNYRTDIQNTITANGFQPIPLGTIGGGNPNSSNCRLMQT